MHFTANPNVVVVGQNPERADYDNPRGLIHGDQWVVVASNAHGDTWEFVAGMNDEGRAEAEKLVARLQARFDNFGKLPVGFSNWTRGRAVYGSDAYIAYGNDEELAMERRELADEAMGL